MEQLQGQWQVISDDKKGKNGHPRLRLAPGYRIHAKDTLKKFPAGRKIFLLSGARQIAKQGK